MMKTEIVHAGALVAVSLFATSGVLAADWIVGGHDDKNSRYQSEEKHISPATVGNLTLRWSTSTSGDVTASPTIDGDFLYFPDSAGRFHDRCAGRDRFPYRSFPGQAER